MISILRLLTCSIDEFTLTEWFTEFDLGGDGDGSRVRARSRVGALGFWLAEVGADDDAVGVFVNLDARQGCRSEHPGSF